MNDMTIFNDNINKLPEKEIKDKKWNADIEDNLGVSNTWFKAELKALKEVLERVV